MKGFGLLFLVLWLLTGGGLGLASCTPAPPPATTDFAYASAAFSATVRGSFTPADGVPRPVAAAVTVGAPTGGGERPMSLSFTAPDALAGVTVTVTPTPDAEGGGHTVAFTADSPYGRVTSSADGGELDGLLRFAEALLPQGEVVAVSPSEEDGTHTVTCRTSDGRRETVFRFSGTGGLPLRVTVRTEGETVDLAVTEGAGVG